MAALAVRKWDANDLVRNRLLAVLKTILHQQAAILVEVSQVYVINSNTAFHNQNNNKHRNITPMDKEYISFGLELKLGMPLSFNLVNV